MSAISRTASLNYGGITISTAASGYALEGPISREGGYRSETWRAGVIVYGSSASDLESKVSALATAFRTPRQVLTVTQGGTPYVRSEAAQTAYNITPSLQRKAGSSFDSHVTREFEVSVSMKLPANLDGDAGLEDYSYIVTNGPNGRRTISASGSYTLTPGNDASAIYSAAIETLLTSIKNEVDSAATWKEVERDTVPDRFDQEYQWRVTYVEQLFKNSVSTFNVAAIKDATIIANTSVIYAENVTPDIEFPQEIAIEYRATIDKTLSTDLGGLWLGTITPMIQEYAETVGAIYGNSSPVILELSPSFDPTSNIIIGRCRFRVFGAQKLILSKTVESYNFRPGAKKVAVYDTSGFERVRVPSIGSYTCAIRTEVVVQGDRQDALNQAKLLTRPPDINIAGGGFTPTAYKGLSRAEYNKLGISGGGWTMESDSPEFEGPSYAGLPSIPITGCALTRVFDYDLDAQTGATASSGLRGAYKIKSGAYGP